MCPRRPITAWSTPSRENSKTVPPWRRRLNVPPERTMARRRAAEPFSAMTSRRTGSEHGRAGYLMPVLGSVAGSRDSSEVHFGCVLREDIIILPPAPWRRPAHASTISGLVTPGQRLSNRLITLCTASECKWNSGSGLESVYCSGCSLGPLREETLTQVDLLPLRSPRRLTIPCFLPWV